MNLLAPLLGARLVTAGLLVYGLLSPVALAADTAGAGKAEAEHADAQRVEAENPEEAVVFRSDVSLVRVDVQVLDRANRAVAGLDAQDFILTEAGRPRQIRNFVSEQMPVDVLFLLDVSGSMRVNIERVATASHQAFQVLGPDDRVAVMVFDRATRVRSGFRPQREGPRELDNVIRQESFDGGTDILRAMLDAARFMERSARREARRAIVIVTDDQTEFNRDDQRVESALIRADTVLFALLAPDVLGYGQRRTSRGRFPGGGRSGGGWPGGGWPGSGGGLGWPGGIPWPGGGGGTPLPGGRGGGRTSAGGSPEIARESGGDSFSVDDATALETTLSRLRQRYALHFVVPDGVRAGEQRRIEVSLASSAARRYAGAELRYRHVYIAPSTTATPAEVSSDVSPADPSAAGESSAGQNGGWRSADSAGTGAHRDSGEAERPRMRRRPAGESTGPRGPIVGDDPSTISSNTGASNEGAWKPIEQSTAAKQTGGWRTATEEEVEAAQKSEARKQ
ncbi:MAG: VWA domain-containing protein [Bryobacteraceae bacterium]